MEERQVKKCFLIFVLLLFTARLSALADSAIVPDPEDLPKEEAVRIATEQFLAACGFNKEILAEFTAEADLREANTIQSGVMPRRWQVLFFYKENASVYYTVYVDSSSRKIILVDPEDFSARLKECKKNAQAKRSAIEQGEIWTSEKGPWRLWSYQDKAAFVSAYGRDPDGHPRQDIGLPDDMDISLQQAISTAKTVIVREFGETVERLDLLKLDCTFYIRRLLTNGAFGRAWLIVFRDLYENGIYQPLYEASILSSSGEVVIIFDYTAVLSGTGNMKFWPPEPEPTAPPVTVEGDIYYNPRGGKYYHANVRCPSVNEKYLPLTLIDQSKMNEAQYRNLRPCPVCTSQK
jgi:hypothetical protein